MRIQLLAVKELKKSVDVGHLWVALAALELLVHLDCKNAISSIKDSIKKYEKKIKLLKNQERKTSVNLKEFPA